MKTPSVTARAALLKFNQVMFALTFQSLLTVHIVFKVVSLYTHSVCLSVCYVCADQTTATEFCWTPEDAWLYHFSHLKEQSVILGKKFGLILRDVFTDQANWKIRTLLWLNKLKNKQPDLKGQHSSWTLLRYGGPCHLSSLKRGPPTLFSSDKRLFIQLWKNCFWLCIITFLIL